MTMPARSRTLLAIAVLCFGAVGVALLTQHVLDMQPCPWCVLQRLIFVLIGGVALTGLVWQSRLGLRLLPLLLLALAGAGVAAALWQHFVAAASASCNLTLADRIVSGLQLDAILPPVFQATANCADAAIDLFGISYEFWSLALFVVVETMVVWMLIRERSVPAT
jgi:protein dithiol:quinone oxidoreductase